MKKYRSKPVEIEAERWWRVSDFEENNPRLVGYYRHPDHSGGEVCSSCGVVLHDHGFLDQPNCSHKVCPGDWVVLDSDGSYYPCKDSVFKRKYEEILG